MSKANDAARRELELDEALEAGAAAGAYVSPFFLSHPYLGLGERDRAISSIERAFEERDGNLIWNLPDPILDPIRGDPRFEHEGVFSGRRSLGDQRRRESHATSSVSSEFNSEFFVGTEGSRKRRFRGSAFQRGDLQ